MIKQRQEHFKQDKNQIYTHSLIQLHQYRSFGFLVVGDHSSSLKDMNSCISYTNDWLPRANRAQLYLRHNPPQVVKAWKDLMDVLEGSDGDYRDRYVSLYCAALLASRVGLSTEQQLLYYINGVMSEKRRAFLWGPVFSPPPLATEAHKVFRPM